MTASLQLAAVELRVPDLARSLNFYAGQLGFSVTSRAAASAQLAVAANASPILTLNEDRHATPSPRDAAGLFHAALLFPHRAALGRWLRLAAERRVEFDGFSDHGVSEALYFSDPDGNGLEFYVDRPRAEWPFADGELAMTTQALDVDSLLAAGASAHAAADASPPLSGAAWGHLHLRVTDLARSEAFYRATLGLQTTQSSYPGARFLAADGYHHHLGLNVWGQPRRPQPADAWGLMSATFRRAEATAVQAVHDPDGIALRIATLR